ncbi:MAG: hypothetical protein LRY27_01545 [Chitinophagales bacterium]|nr:hypothetical protein [Chitinophagales bacterium]
MNQKHPSISVPKPCHEKWENMKPTQEGAFCLTCCHEVIDFTSMTDKEVITCLEKYKSKDVCGRFKNTQLATTEIKTALPLTIYSRFKKLVLGLFVGMSLFRLLRGKRMK